MKDFTLTLTDGTEITAGPIGTDGHSVHPFQLDSDEAGVCLYWAIGWRDSPGGYVNTRTRFIHWTGIRYIDRPDGPIVWTAP